MKKAQRTVTNPLYGRPIPETLRGAGIDREVKNLWSRKKLSLPAPTREILPLQARLRPLLKRVWRDGSKKDISWMTADLAGLWEVSRNHIILVRNLLKMGAKPNLEKLKQFSQDLDVNWLSNASGHLQTFRPELARFKQSLYRKRHRTKRR